LFVRAFFGLSCYLFIGLASVKKIPFLLLLALSAGHAYAQKTEQVTIPAGVNYKYTCDSKIQEAKKLLKRDLADSSSYQLSGASLIIGPVLWHRYQHIPAISQIKEGHVTFHLGPQTLDGKLSQSETDTRTIWAVLRRELAGQPFTIRKATEKELQYYWAVISFDIEEPLLIVDAGKRRYLLNIVPKTMKLMWLDEIPPAY
jgi:hypothetical protein